MGVLGRLARAAARGLISAVPFKRLLLAHAAALPCRAKQRLFRHPLVLRIFSSLLFRYRARPPFPIHTNLGISDSTSVELPSRLARPADLFGTPDLYRGERGPLLVARQLCRRCGAFVDVGAHIGYYTHFVRAHAEAPIEMYYFEPDPDCYRIIADGLARTGTDHLHGFNQAIGARAGTAHFFQDLGNSSMSSLVPDATHRQRVIPVDVVPFDAFAAGADLRDRYLVKVDVENAEWDFVAGAVASLASMPYLILEILGPARERGLIDHLIRSFGFRCYYINGLRLEPMAADDARYTPGEWNYLFCRESPAELREHLALSPLQVA